MLGGGRNHLLDQFNNRIYCSRMKLISRGAYLVMLIGLAAILYSIVQGDGPSLAIRAGSEAVTEEDLERDLASCEDDSCRKQVIDSAVETARVQTDELRSLEARFLAAQKRPDYTKALAVWSECSSAAIDKSGMRASPEETRVAVRQDYELRTREIDLVRVLEPVDSPEGVDSPFGSVTEPDPEALRQLQELEKEYKSMIGLVDECVESSGLGQLRANLMKEIAGE